MRWLPILSVIPSKVEMLFGDCLVVGPKGELICFRKVQKPSKHHVMVSHLPTFTCSTFFRRSVLDKHGLFFDSKWRDLGDAEWGPARPG